MRLDPIEAAHDVRPNLPQKFKIPGPFEIKASEQNEQRGGVYASVIEAEWHLAQIGHFPVPHLMQDLAWLSIGGVVDGFGLEMGEPLQHAARDRSIEPKCLHGRDEAVAAEGRGIPGDSGIGILALRRFRHQHSEISKRTADDLVDDGVRRFDGHDVMPFADEVAPCLKKPPQE